MERAAGDAVAFSVETALQRHAQLHSRAAAATLPLCLVRVERRRSERHAWDRVLDETTVLQSLNYVSRLERHRFEYRVSLRSCSDPLLLAMPSELWISRVHSGAAYQHPHVGTFRLISTAQRPVEITIPGRDTSGSIIYAIAIAAVLAGALLLIARKCKIESIKLSRWWKQSVARFSALSRWWEQPLLTRKDKKVEAENQTSVTREIAQHDFPVFEDLDEEENEEPDVANELLMSELPDFNDESGWRDFFESQIYHRDDRQKQRDSEERSGPVRQRTLITRSSNSGGEARRSDRPTRIVAAVGKQPIYSSPNRIEDKLGGGSQIQGSGSVVSASQNVTSLRHPSGSSFRSETAASSSTATMGSSRATMPQRSRVLEPSSPADDFGEFWQM